MDPRKFDDKIEEFKQEDPSRKYDTKHLEEFDVVDGKSRFQEDVEKLKELESLLGVREMNPYGTLSKEIFAEKLSSMTTTDLQNLAIRVGIPPSRDHTALKRNLAKSHDLYLRQHNMGSMVAARPLIDPSSPNYDSVVKLFKEGI